MTSHYTFSINNMTPAPKLHFSHTYFFILRVIFKVFFFILLSLKNNKINDNSKLFSKMVFQKYKNESRI